MTIFEICARLTLGLFFMAFVSLGFRAETLYLRRLTRPAAEIFFLLAAIAAVVCVWLAP